MALIMQCLIKLRLINELVKRKPIYMDLNFRLFKFHKMGMESLR